VKSPLDNTQLILVRLGSRSLEHFVRWLNHEDALIELREKCTLSVPRFDYPATEPLVALILADKGDDILYVAVAHRGHPRATDIEAQIKFEDGQRVSPKENLSRLRNAVSPRYARYCTDEHVTSGGVLPPTISKEFLKALLADRPELRKSLETALAKTTDSFPDATDEQKFVFQQQKDAVQIALTIAKIHRHDYLKIEGQPSIDRSFLSQIKANRRTGLTENTILNHDSKRFPFLEPLRQLRHTVARFGDDRVRLDVIFAHNEMLETVTGADLIYFNATYQAFVFVQYKALDSAGTSTYRLDSRLEKQIKKMERLRKRSTNKINASELTPMAYRLGSEFLFVKFCERQDDLVGDDTLISGYYIPVDYFNRLNAGKTGGGAVITKEALNRSLSNTDFSAMVRNAWIGSGISQYDAIKDLIETNIATGRAVTVAIEKTIS
jgi:hypothetical protein